MKSSSSPTCISTRKLLEKSCLKNGCTVHELAELDLLEVEDNWVEKSQTTVLEGGIYGEQEGFEDITWIYDLIEIDEVDI